MSPSRLKIWCFLGFLWAFCLHIALKISSDVTQTQVAHLAASLDVRLPSPPPPGATGG